MGKAHAAYLEAKMRWEREKVNVSGKEEMLEEARKRSKATKEKTDEALKIVEDLREGKTAEDVSTLA